MTRIFDALRKAQVMRPARVEPVPSPISAPSSQLASARAARPVPVRGGRGVTPRPLALPPRSTASLPEDVLRGMITLRVSLEAALPEGAPRIVAFTSSQAGEGTSTVALEFALTLAQDSRIRTLLVDLHARRPAYPSPEADTAGSAEGMVVAHLDVLPLAALYHSTGMIPPLDVRPILESLASAYDWLVLDGPPVLDSPEAATLAAVADGVVVVVQAHRTKRPVLTRAVDLLRKSGSRVLGSVLNRRRLEIPEFIYRRI